MLPFKIRSATPPTTPPRSPAPRPGDYGPLAPIRPQGRAMRLVRLNWALGAGLGLAAAASLILADFAGLARLIAAGREPFAALVLLGAGFATLFGAVAAAGAVMLIPAGKESGRGGRRAEGRLYSLPPVDYGSPMARPDAGDSGFSS